MSTKEPKKRGAATRRWLVLDLVYAVYIARGNTFTSDPNRAHVFFDQAEADAAVAHARKAGYRAVRAIGIPET